MSELYDALPPGGATGAPLPLSEVPGEAVARLQHALAEKQRQLELMQRCAVEINRAGTVLQALPVALGTACDLCGFAIGHAYVVAPGPPPALVSARCWAGPQAAAHPAFVAASEAARLAADDSFVGQVLTSGRLLWSGQLATEPTFRRTDEALAAGLNAVVVLPVRRGEAVVAVLEFFAPTLLELTPSVLDGLDAIAAQVGGVAEREAVLARLHAREQQLAEAQQLTHIGSWDWDVRTGALTWSDEMYRIYGLDPEDGPITFEQYSALQHPEDGPRTQEIIAASLQNGEPFDFLHRIVRPDGTERTLRGVGRVEMEAGRPVRMLGTGQDVTDTHRLTVEREAYAARLARSNRDLEDFAYAASHDLQEPLRKIRAFSDLLVAEHAATLADDARRYLGRIEESAARMSRLINDLLALSHIATRPATHEVVPLDALARTVVHNLGQRLDETGGRIEVAGPLPIVHGERAQLQQLLHHLAGNAIKFSRAGVPPLVRLRAETGGGTVRLVVEDNGLGFEPRYAERIFKPFERLHPVGTYEGSGMGLAICRRIAERHGGTLTAESTPGEGSRFVVTLPV
jgi:signal transduction histidine kinase